MKKSTVTIKNNNAVFVAKSNNESNSISDLQISINVFFFFNTHKTLAIPINIPKALPDAYKPF